MTFEGHNRIIAIGAVVATAVLTVGSPDARAIDSRDEPGGDDAATESELNAFPRALARYAGKS